MVLQMSVAREPVMARPHTTVAPESPAVARFLSAARARGLEPMPLQVRPVEPPFFVIGDPPSLLDVRWRQRFTLRLGKRSLSWTLPRAGTFFQVSPEEMVMPVQAQSRYQESLTLPEIEERTVLVERADPILAVRVDGQWFELDRWARPVFRAGAASRRR